MKVFVVIGVYQGIPTQIETVESPQAARRRGYELASNYGLLERPWDWSSREDGRWDRRRGSQRAWPHHWYNDESDVLVAQCDL